jgi:hypothetical protein
VAGGVRDEVQHPHTPQSVKAAVLPRIFNLGPSLNSSQQAARRSVRAILQGNAKPDTHAADASHLSEAAEIRCAYFITNDKRILKKRYELYAALPPTLTILTLAEFLEVSQRSCWDKRCRRIGPLSLSLVMIHHLGMSGRKRAQWHHV